MPDQQQATTRGTARRSRATRSNAGAAGSVRPQERRRSRSKLARTTYIAAATPMGTVSRLDWTYRSRRPSGGGPSTARICLAARIAERLRRRPRGGDRGVRHVRSGHDPVTPARVGGQRTRDGDGRVRHGRGEVAPGPFRHHECAELGTRDAATRERAGCDEHERITGQRAHASARPGEPRRRASLHRHLSRYRRRTRCRSGRCRADRLGPGRRHAAARRAGHRART